LKGKTQTVVKKTISRYKQAQKEKGKEGKKLRQWADKKKQEQEQEQE